MISAAGVCSAEEGPEVNSAGDIMVLWTVERCLRVAKECCRRVETCGTLNIDPERAEL